MVPHNRSPGAHRDRSPWHCQRNLRMRTRVPILSILLVGGFNHLEKYEFVNGKDDNPYMKWKIKKMFQTTNQIFFIYILYLYVDLFILFLCLYLYLSTYTCHNMQCIDAYC